MMHANALCPPGTQVMQHASEVNKREMTLLKVAIVALKDEVFVGRLFFGDAVTKKVMWDCDCRPSDGCYLHLKVGPEMHACMRWAHAASASAWMHTQDEPTSSVCNSSMCFRSCLQLCTPPGF